MGIPNFFYKVCIVGNSGVGKTTLLHRYLENRFNPNVTSTIGSHFFVKYLRIPDEDNLITLQIWDLAGQAHFKWVRHVFYKGAKGVVYVFDLTRKNTFEDILGWKKEIETSIGMLPNVLVGNKLDLVNSENTLIAKEELDSLTEYLDACAYYKTSAKTGTRVNNVFKSLTLEMYNSQKKLLERNRKQFN
ncbi:MAG: Rab family GTPase [Promethearchaeota archaeon]